MIDQFCDIQPDKGEHSLIVCVMDKLVIFAWKHCQGSSTFRSAIRKMCTSATWTWHEPVIRGVQLFRGWHFTEFGMKGAASSKFVLSTGHNWIFIPSISSNTKWFTCCFGKCWNSLDFQFAPNVSKFKKNIIVPRHQPWRKSGTKQENSITMT